MDETRRTKKSSAARTEAAMLRLNTDVLLAKSFARRVERHLAAYGQAELDRRELADMIAATDSREG
jgi:hypothetical protein